MKHLFFGSVVLLTLAAARPVVAADMPMGAPVYKAAPAAVMTVYNWTGIYVGGHLGGAWAKKEWTGLAGVTPGFVDANHTAKGFMGGAQAGFNYQTGLLVWGIEGDWSWTNLSASSTCFEFFGGGPQSCNSEVKWFGTLTGRVGWASDRTLFYAKGGAAWARDDFSNPCSACSNQNGPTVWSTPGKVRTGWTAGVGIEYGITPQWSAKIEYDYMDFGTKSVHFTSPLGDPFDEEIKQHVHIVKAGLNYKFY